MVTEEKEEKKRSHGGEAVQTAVDSWTKQGVGMDPYAIKNPNIALTPPKLKLSLSTHQRFVPGHLHINTVCKYQNSWVLKSFI